MSETKKVRESWITIGLLHAGALFLCAQIGFERALYTKQFLFTHEVPGDTWFWYSFGAYTVCAIVGLILSSLCVLPFNRRAWPFAWAVITACVAGAALLVLP